jgi:hypothetical protein
MPFPDADRATVSDEKLRKYLLNLEHPIGGAKARWFATLGFTLENLDEFRASLLGIAHADDEFVSTASPYGVKYEAQGEMGRPGFRQATVVTIWIVAGNDPPRLVTAYPAGELT